MDNFTFDYFSEKLKFIERLLVEIKTQGETTMAQIDDLNAAIQAEDVEINDLLPVVTKIGTDIAALLAAVKAGSTPTDLTNQITAVQAHVASLTTALGQLQADDTSANPPATPAA